MHFAERNVKPKRRTKRVCFTVEQAGDRPYGRLTTVVKVAVSYNWSNISYAGVASLFVCMDRGTTKRVVRGVSLRL